MDKKAQIAETMTWVAATLIILVILTIAIFAASSMGITNRAVTVKADESPILLKKSLQAYLLTEDLEKESNVLSKLSVDKSDSFSEELGKKVFNDSSGVFSFTLEFDAWELTKNYREKIKINEKNVLGVFKYGSKKKATI